MVFQQHYCMRCLFSTQPLPHHKLLIALEMLQYLNRIDLQDLEVTLLVNLQ